MGLGKTSIFLTALTSLLMMEDIRTLIVGPLRVISVVWPNEIKKWTHTKDLKYSLVVGTERQRVKALQKEAQVYLINGENFRWLVKLFKPSKWPFNSVVLDESHLFKNAKARRSHAASAVAPRVARWVNMTGTPTASSVQDLWTPQYFVDSGQALGPRYSTFEETYFTKDEYAHTLTPKQGAVEHIIQAIAPTTLSMRSEDYLTLPELIVTPVVDRLPTELRKQYDKLHKQFVLEVSEQKTVTADSAAIASSKCRQFLNGFIYDEDKKAHDIHDLKLRSLQGVVDELQGAPVVVVWSFRRDLERIKRMFPQAKQPGDVANVESEWNAGNIPMLLLYAGEDAFGLNLQFGGRHIIWFGPTWQFVVWVQLHKRLHRMGQRSTVMAYVLMFENTVETLMMMPRLVERRELSDLVFELTR